MKNAFALFVFVGVLLVPVFAFAKVNKTGTWPEHDKAISFDADHITRSAAITKLANAAGWSLVISSTQQDSGLNALDNLVDVHMKNQEADKVLSVLLAEGDFTCDRDGTLITITPSHADALPIPAAAPVPTAVASAGVANDHHDDDAAPSSTVPSKRGEDRTVRNGSLTIETDEIVHDVTVLAGNADIRGTVTGNLTVAAGSAHVRKSAHIVGSATAISGSINIDDGATIDGSVDAFGGTIRRGGRVSAGVVHDSAPKAVRLLGEIGEAITRTAVLFVFGTVLLALAGTKMETFRVEVASRPMRTFALGVVGLIGGALTLIALCVTVVGIPVAIVLAILAPFAAFAGICAVLGTVGKALIGHKTASPYLHLALGCVLFLVVGAIPYVDGIVTFIVIMMGIGVIVGTRAAGYWPTRKMKLGPESPSAM